MSIQGYIYVIIQSVTLDNATEPVKLELSLTSGSKATTALKPSGSQFNEVFLMEVPKEPTKLNLNALVNQKSVGESRYDITPFYSHPGGMNVMESDLYGGEQNLRVGKVKFSLTFYSAEHGRLRVRIFNLQLAEGLAEQFKQAKIKVRFGIHAQATPVRPLKDPFDETVEVLVLDPTTSLQFDLVHEQGILANYNIPNAQQGKMLNEQTKAFQVSLFNNSKPIALIKYQLDWLRPKKNQ